MMPGRSHGLLAGLRVLLLLMANNFFEHIVATQSLAIATRYYM